MLGETKQSRPQVIGFAAPFAEPHVVVLVRLEAVQAAPVLGEHYRPDLTVYDAIVVELKAISDLNSDHEAQLFNYLRISRQQIGYLLNFGKKAELQWKRFILTDLHSLREEGNTDRH